MAAPILHVAEDFWNFRDSYEIGGVIDVGTQASLVRRASGKFVFLDSYTLSGAARRKVGELTRDGKDIEAILNVHPFHTVHVRKMHRMYPQARLYGTARHLSRFPELPWAETCTEDPALHEQFAGDFRDWANELIERWRDAENLCDAHPATLLATDNGGESVHARMLKALDKVSKTLNSHERKFP